MLYSHKRIYHKLFLGAKRKNRSAKRGGLLRRAFAATVGVRVESWRQLPAAIGLALAQAGAEGKKGPSEVLVERTRKVC